MWFSGFEELLAVTVCSHTVNRVIIMSSWDSLDSWSNYASYPPETLEETLYQHLQTCRQQEPPHKLIERFRQLFIEGGTYQDEQVRAALLELVKRPQASREFKYILNRCCYTLINPWYTQPRDHWAITEMIAQFEQLPAATARSPELQTLHSVVEEFVNSEQYAALARLRQIFEAPKAFNGVNSAPLEEQALRDRIRNYPFLYDHSLLTKDSTQEQKQNVLDLRCKEESKLRINITRYHSYCQGLSRNRQLENPTLLELPQFEEAITHYTGKIDGNRSQRDLANWFTTYSRTTRSFRDFKDEFVDYLINPIAAVEPKYSGNHFTRRLRQYLRETLSEFDGQRLNNFILVETCRRVLNFLVVDSPQRPVFRNFRHLLNDIGQTLTVGLLLRVVLFCSAARPWLERCFSVLFNYHEENYCTEVPWLVESLEHTNVALITNFGAPAL